MGWGEATALPQWGGLHGRHYGETRETVVSAILDIFAPILLGADARIPAGIMRRLDEALRGHPYAKATVEIALQDIRGKACGEPVFRLLGGPVRDRVRLAHMITMMSNEEALAETQAVVADDGITAFQVKCGIDPDRDVALVRTLRKALGDDVFIKIDANRGYGRRPFEVAAICRRLVDAGVDAIEQPADSADAMVAATQAVDVAVIADESCWSASDVLALWRDGGASAASVYVAKAGGIAAAADVARTADLVGWPADLNGSLESGIGASASLQVALAMPGVTNPSIIPVPSLAEKPMTKLGGRYWEDGIVSSGIRYEEGHLLLDGAPGLGIEVDEERLRRYATHVRRIEAE